MKFLMVLTAILIFINHVENRKKEIIAWDQFSPSGSVAFHHKINMFFYDTLSPFNTIITTSPINTVYPWLYAERRIPTVPTVTPFNKDNISNNSRYSNYIFSYARTHLHNYVIWNDDNLSLNSVSLSCSGASITTRQLNIQFNIKFFPCINDALTFYNSIDSTNANKTPKILFNRDGTINSQKNGWKKVVGNIQKDGDPIPIAKIGDVLMGDDLAIETLCP